MKKKRSEIPLAVLAGALIIALPEIIANNKYESSKKNTLNEMSSILDQRVCLINNFIDNAEQTLNIYSSAYDITAMLNEPENKDLTKRAKAVGMITRSDPQSLKALHEKLFAAGGEVCNLGILMSPATNLPSLILYKAIYNDNNEPIGIAGLNMNIDQLTEKLKTKIVKEK